MNKRSSKSGLFLMELIIAILVFSIASALCIQIFAKSHILSQTTQELNHAVSMSESAAEIFYGTDGTLEEVSKILDSAHMSIQNGNTITLFYDSSFQICMQEEAIYTMLLEFSSDQKFQMLCIHVNRLTGDSPNIYSLDVKRHIQQ